MNGNNSKDGLKEKRRKFCYWFGSYGANVSSDILFTDEAEFKHNGIQNFTLNVWCGIVGNRLIGPHFLLNPLTGEGYLNFLANELLPLINADFSIEERERMWFMHDGAPQHTCKIVQQFLNVHFPNRWIGKGGKEAWPPHSSDLNPIDFYVWNEIKRIVDAGASRRISSLEEYQFQFYDAFDTFRSDLNNFNCVHDMDHKVPLCIRADGYKFKALEQKFFRKAKR